MISGQMYTRAALLAALVGLHNQNAYASDGSVKHCSRTVNGVCLLFDTLAEASVPVAWRDSPVWMATKSCRNKSKARRAVRIFSRAYPLSLLRSDLDVVAAFGAITAYGVRYGGTYHARTLYLSTAMHGGGVAHVSDLTYALHHEMSSVLMSRNELTLDGWSALNDPGFRYYGGGATMIADEAAMGRLSYSDEHLYAAGFLTRYATAEAEEDFNTYAGFLLARRQTLCDLAKNYPRVAAKAAFVEYFYTTLGLNLAPCE